MFSPDNAEGNFPEPLLIAALREHAMLEIKNAAGQIIAADTQASIAAIDQAVLSCSRLCGSLVEVSASARLPVGTLQKALSNTAEAISAAVRGREEITFATRELRKVQAMSTLEATSFGCPDGFPLKLSALVPDDTAIAKA